MQPVASSLTNVITIKGVMRAEKGQEEGFFSLLVLALMMKVLGKWVRRAWRGYSFMNHMGGNP